MTENKTVSQKIVDSITAIENEIVVEVLKTYDENPDQLTPELRKIVEKLFV